MGKSRPLMNGIMISRLACCVALVTAAAGCYRPDDYLLGPSQADQALVVTVSATTVSADGISRVTITAQLDPRTDADKRILTFTTTAGTLSFGGKEGLSITAPADTSGKAVVELRSSTTAGMAQLEVTVAGVSRTVSVAFVKLTRAEAFDVSVSRTSVPADGFSTAVITVTLKRVGTLLQRAVRFETSAGTLIATGEADSRAVTVTANETGRAEVALQSEKTIGTARVRVTAIDISQDLDITFTPVDPAQIITVSAAPSSVPADGATPLIVSAMVAAGLPAGRRSVAFRATLGQLLPVVIEADGSNVARATLISTTTGTTRITATVDGTTADTTARFTVALPDRLHIQLDDVELKSGESTAIRVTLLRDTGSVSPHLGVSYTATSHTGAAVGSFSGVTLAENAVATATFNVGTTSFLGAVTIRATAEGGETTSATLQVVP
jgi:adhesin/invasin